ncbi:hypothetical protein L596_010491 [Steinernema carpocapsae]|uniref:C-type lectin domain-containing protein n=1 Tax=Steinernema carpocapsae TaxID=34508 RepID=A0A4U5PJ83_STECR|nr:hypothetical protein L596_010491 [Steinernema carpocapsae]
MLKLFALLALGALVSGRANFDSVLLSHDKLTWYQANDFCLNHGYNLVSIHNIEEQNIVAKAVDALNFWGWIGGYRVTHRNLFMWMDGTAFDYNNWKEPPKFPSQNPRYACLSFNHRDHLDNSGQPLNNTWTNYACDQRAYAVCLIPFE